MESRLAEISAANDAAASALKDAERRLGDMALLIKNLSAYKQLRPVALELRNAKDKAAFRRQHESQLILYEAAAKALKEAGIAKLPNLYALKTEYKKLDAERERLSAPVKLKPAPPVLIEIPISPPLILCEYPASIGESYACR